MKTLALLLVSLFIADVGIHIHAQSPSAAGTAHGVRNDLPQPYETQRNWDELPEGAKWAAVTAVEPSPDGQFIYVIHRCNDNSCDGRSEAPILKYDYDGKLLDSFV